MQIRNFKYQFVIFIDATDINPDAQTIVKLQEKLAKFDLVSRMQKINVSGKWYNSLQFISANYEYQVYFTPDRLFIEQSAIDANSSNMKSLSFFLTKAYDIAEEILSAYPSKTVNRIATVKSFFLHIEGGENYDNLFLSFITPITISDKSIVPFEWSFRYTTKELLKVGRKEKRINKLVNIVRQTITVTYSGGNGVEDVDSALIQLDINTDNQDKTSSFATKEIRSFGVSSSNELKKMEEIILNSAKNEDN